jgi:hypothetical protein
MRATCPAHLIVFSLIIVIISGEEDELNFVRYGNEGASSRATDAGANVAII